jgi:hypothetical protein
VDLRGGSEREREGEEVIAGWRKLRNDAFHTLYYSSNIIMIIKSSRM